MKKLFSALASCTFLVCALLASNISAQFGQTDFLIADYGGNRIAVYNQSLAFQNYLDTGFNQVAGLSQLSAATIAAGGGTPGRIKVYDSTGAVLQDFTNVNIGATSDLKSSGGNLLFVGTQNAGSSVAVFTSAGTFQNSIGSNAYSAVAVLPGNVLWAVVNNGNTVDVFDITTGSPITTIPLNNNGQMQADSMFYSATTSTVLIVDSFTNSVFERTLTGAFVRQFTGGGATLGVTRGPGDDVYATEFNPSRVHRWTSTGTYMGSTDISANVTGGFNIIWMGNLAPTAASISVSGRVMDAGGRGVYRASVSLTGTTGAVRTVLTSPLGYFQFDDVTAGGSYLFSVRHKLYSFEPRLVAVNNDISDLDFIIQPTQGPREQKGRLK